MNQKIDEIFHITENMKNISYDDVLNMSLYEKDRLINLIEKRIEKEKNMISKINANKTNKRRK